MLSDSGVRVPEKECGYPSVSNDFHDIFGHISVVPLWHDTGKPYCKGNYKSSFISTVEK